MKKLFLIFLFTSQIFATNWYVDGRLVTGSNNGTSWANAWRSFDDIIWTSIAAGDVIYISGRDAGGANDSTVYYGALIPQCRGNASNETLITTGKYSPSPSGHSGRVIIDGGGNMYTGAVMGGYSGTHTGSNNQATVMTDASAHFDAGRLIGLTITNDTDALWHPGDPGYWTYGSGTIISNTGTTITVSAMTDGTDNDWDTGDAYSIIPRDYGILINEYSATAPAYLRIKGIETRCAFGGVRFDLDIIASTSNCYKVTIDSFYISDFYDLAGVAFMGGVHTCRVTKTVIKTCLRCGDQTDCIHVSSSNSPYHPTMTIIDNNVILNRNQDPNAHNDAIQGVYGCDGFIVYNNIIVNDSVYSFEGGGLPFILSDWDMGSDDFPPVILYNNFCYMGGVWYPGGNMGWTMWSRFDGTEDPTLYPPNYIFNNTVVTNGPRVGGYNNQYPFTIWMNNVNAMYCLPDGTLGENWRTGGTHGWQSNIGLNINDGVYQEVDSIRSNLFWKEDSTNALFAGDFAWNGGQGGIANWNDWISKGGTGLFRNPNFVNHFGHEPDQTQLRPDVKAGSPVIGAGESIQYLYDYFIGIGIPAEYVDPMFYDIYNNPRDIDNPSIGAYEYQVGGGGQFKIMGVDAAKVQGVAPSKVWGIQ